MPLYGMLLDNMPRIYMKDMFLFNVNTSNQVIHVIFFRALKQSKQGLTQSIWWEEVQVYAGRKLTNEMQFWKCWFICTHGV